MAVGAVSVEVAVNEAAATAAGAPLTRGSVSARARNLAVSQMLLWDRQADMTSSSSGDTSVLRASLLSWFVRGGERNHRITQQQLLVLRCEGCQAIPSASDLSSWHCCKFRISMDVNSTSVQCPKPRFPLDTRESTRLGPRHEWPVSQAPPPGHNRSLGGLGKGQALLSAGPSPDPAAELAERLRARPG